MYFAAFFLSNHKSFVFASKQNTGPNSERVKIHDKY